MHIFVCEILAFLWYFNLEILLEMLKHRDKSLKRIIHFTYGFKNLVYLIEQTWNIIRKDKPLKRFRFILLVWIENLVRLTQIVFWHN